MVLLNEVDGFDWDKGNIDKNWEKHRVSHFECEEIFFNEPLVVPDDKHSKMEQRFYALGRTNQDRLLFVVYTIRSNKIRVISARDMNKRERGCYQ